jgi:glycosyltransferase involved in cell wall biosynthesis
LVGPPRRRLSALVRFLNANPRSALAGRVYERAKSIGSGIPTLDTDITLKCSAILKRPGPDGELGYLLVEFEPELEKLARSPHLGSIQAEYDILFLATWQPYHSEPLCMFAGRAERPLVLMPSSRADYELGREVQRDMVCMPFQSSSWVHPRFFVESPRKDVDILMLANFSAYKRHWVLFEALRDLPRSLRVVLIGVPYQRTREDLLREARLFGTEDRFEILESPPNEVVADHLARARVFLGMTYLEGSYISIGEALMSNTPVGLFRDAIVGSKDYINPETGVLFDPGRPLAPQILSFLERAHTFTPGRWARANIASEVNSAKLNGLLRDLAASQGRPWTRDIEPVHCRHFRFHYDREGAEEEFRPAYDQFRERYGITIERAEES